MPNISASEYTQYLKLKTAAVTGIRPGIQTRDNATLSQSVLNANIFTSQASFLLTPTLTRVVGNARVVPAPPNNVNNPNALSTLSYSTSGATTSSKFQQPGGLPAKNVVGTYYRIPQNAGNIQPNMVSSGAKRF